jgi:hypothetical protein
VGSVMKSAALNIAFRRALPGTNEHDVYIFPALDEFSIS